MKHTLIAVILALIATIPLTSEAKPQFRAAVAQGWAVALPDGDPTPLPPVSILATTMNVPLGDTWGWTTDVGIATPNGIFHPNPRAMTGAYWKWESFSLVAGGAYQRNIAYEGTKSANVAWLTVAPGFAITKEVAFIFPLGVGKTFGAGNPWFVNGGPRLSFLLPF